MSKVGGLVPRRRSATPYPFGSKFLSKYQLVSIAPIKPPKRPPRNISKSDIEDIASITSINC
ncbi:hypothetical protein DBX26_07555 [Vibrio sp. dhg]|nr:hypothetical protein DBX26_07555 [Vibrio sp. dhg]